ncbi:hypothetical protein HC928_14500 [bacterium]|nr:hypothetical protein [bacterium]
MVLVVVLVILLVLGAIALWFFPKGAMLLRKANTRASYDIALIGDLPYNPKEEAQFFTMLQEINQANVEFVIHDGDFKSGSSLCSDEVFASRKALFNQFEPPFIYIFGDNEWTDCHRENNGSYDPIERLAKVRELFAAGNQSLGKRTLPLTRQSEDPQHRKFRENLRWAYGNVLFVGLHVVGSNNNLGRSPEADAEYEERNAANLAWLKESFALAKTNNYPGIMVIIQADPFFEKPETERTGINDFIRLLEKEAIAFEKPVVLVHGDTHYFRIDKPLPIAAPNQPPDRLTNFTRLMTFGSPDVHWVRATIDPNSPNVFEFRQEIVQANRAR